MMISMMISFMQLPWRNSASVILVNLSINSFNEMLRIHTFEFMSRLIVSKNMFVSNIYNSSCRLYLSTFYIVLYGLLFINHIIFSTLFSPLHLDG